MGISWLVIIVGVSSCWAADYELVLENPDIFSPCTEGPPGSIEVPQALDLDQLEIIHDGDTLHVSGNATVKWDVNPKDRITGKLEVFHFSRGSWEPTVFSMVSQDFCTIMYDRNQYWYKMWTAYISNRADVEKKCINTPGTVLVHEPFDLNLRVQNIRGPTLRGRHKLVIVFNALDERNIPRASPICCEIRGEFIKIN
ncbi:uncharacterized protein Dana_GF11760 [Drosophila ananassae]|uniref:Uncharacterized protein n=2 Tax=Drosophila ananassae TaxID=7217 RepID=B3MGR2_DROAN|nr:uncharacterized protein Dana_GF11760 [Drosophila ananassae]